MLLEPQHWTTLVYFRNTKIFVDLKSHYTLIQRITHNFLKNYCTYCLSLLCRYSKPGSKFNAAKITSLHGTLCRVMCGITFHVVFQKWTSVVRYWGSKSLSEWTFSWWVFKTSSNTVCLFTLFCHGPKLTTVARLKQNEKNVFRT